MLKVTGLKKSYGSNHVLKGINLDIPKGCFYSLLGPNGAGKSTTLNCIAQLLHPNEGEIIINSVNTKINSVGAKSIIGVVPQEIALYEELSAWENLVFWGRLNKVNRNDINQRGKSILEKFGLYDRKDEKIKTYSGGMKRRINIAAALLHNPLLILMDEPTVGIDPQSRNNIYEFIELLKSEGKTILYTTHYMEEAQRFSDKIGILDDGKIIAEGTFDEIREQTKIASQLIIEFEGNIENLKNKLSNYHSKINISESRIVVETNDARTDLKNMVTFLNESSVDIHHIEKKQADLETIFLHLTGKQLRD